MTESLRSVNRCLIRKWVCALPLRLRDGKTLFFLYRHRMLEYDNKNPVAAEILKNCGCPEGKPMDRIIYLIHCLRESDADAFPHKIGLFLG